MQFPPEVLQQCWFLAGPTACGKTELSLLLAEHLNAEILAMDSMSLYRGMDIGTAKASAAERERVPHHLLDLIDVHEKYSVAEYFEAAQQCCEEIIARGRTPLFVGGTGLYLRAILRGVFNGPSADWDYRNEMEKLAETEGNEALHRLLQAVDPVSAAKLHPNDVRRVARALEVYHVSGVPLSAQHAEGILTPEECPAHVYWLLPDREWLYDRINLRVDQMLEEGLLDEVKQILTADPPMDRTARQALGYKELIDYLEGTHSYDRAVELLKQQTRRFAKRQHTFFRNIKECRHVPVHPEDQPEDLLERILGFERE